MAVIEEVAVRVSPDFTGFPAKYVRQLLIASRPRTIDVNVDVKTNVSAVRRLHARQMKAIADIGNNALMQSAVRLEAQRKRALAGVEADQKRAAREHEQACRDQLRRVRSCQEQIDRDHVAAIREERERTLRAAQQRRRDDERNLRSQVRRNREALRDAARSRNALSTLFGRVSEAGAGAGIIDLGRRGVRPINALIAAAVAASPVVLALGSSALTASTSLASLGAAALGTASAVGVVAFALHGLGDALKLTQQAQDGSEAAAEKLEARLASMAPAARRLYRELVQIRDEMRGFSQVAQQTVLPGFTAFLESIRARGRGGVSAMGVLKMGMADLGQIISDTAARAGELASTELFKARLARIVNENTAAFGNLNDAVLALLTPVTRIIDASAPQLTRFTAYLERLADRFAAWIAQFSDADLAAWFRHAGDEMAAWGRVAENLLGILYGLFRASAPAGSTLLDRIGDWTGRINDFANTAAGQQKIRQFFDYVAAVPYGKIAAGMVAVVGGFLAVKSAIAVGGGIAGLLGAVASGQWWLVALKLIGAAVFAIGAAAVYAYTQFAGFRDVVNRAVAEFKNGLMAGALPALQSLRDTINDNAGAIKVLAGMFGEFLVATATFAGWAMGSSLQNIANVLRVIIPLMRVLGQTWFELASAALQAGSMQVRAMQAVANAAYKGLRLINPAAYYALGGFMEDLNRVADVTATTLHNMAQDAARSSDEMGKTRDEIARTGAVRAFERAAPTDEAAAKAKDELSAAQARAAQTAKDNAVELTRMNQAVQDARAAARDAAWEITDAERALADAQREARDAQAGLNDARREAAQRLRDLRVQARGLAADEEEARLRLAVSREVLKGFEFSSSVDPLFRRELRLDVAQAEQGLVETLENGRRVRGELSLAERRGIEGSDEVVAARKRIRDANVAVAKAEQDLTRAHEGATRANRDLRTAIDAAARARNDAAASYRKEWADVEAARKKYGELNAELNAVPKDKKTTLTVTPKVGALTAADIAKRRSLTLSVYESQVPKAARASGGPIIGPGTKTSDSVPIWASAGEYMQPATTVDYYGLRGMEAIRRKLIPRQLIDRAGRDRPGYAQGGYVWPLPGYRGITSAYGVNRGSYYHGGTDIGAPTGAGIVSAAAGRVVQSGWYGGGGNTVSVAHAGSLVTRYMHMSSIIARAVNAVVRAGQLLGRVGSTGDSSGPHLHFQAERPPGRTINPMGLIAGAPTGGAIPGPARAATVRTRLDPKYLIAMGAISAAQYGGQLGVRAVNTLGAGLTVPQMSDTFVLPAKAFDNGGRLDPGATLALNRTGRVETVRNAGQEAALAGPVRIDRRDLKLLAAYIATASDRPIDMDGRRVAEAVSGYAYLPPGV